MPINVKSNVQTEPITPPGRIKLGLLIPSYQERSEEVHIAPKAPTRLHKTMQVISIGQFIAILR